MKRLLIISVILLSGYTAMAQHTRLMNDPTPKVRRMMDIYHCAPPDHTTLDIRILDNLLRQLDEGRIFFTQSDADTILHASTLLEQELSGRNSDFLNMVMTMYKSRVVRTDSMVSAILRRPLDLTTPGIAYVSDTSWAVSVPALQAKLHSYMKLHCLYQLSVIASADSSLTLSAVMKREPQVRQKALIAMQRRIRRIVSHPADYEALIVDQLSDAICKAYDPHSDFFTENARAEFVGAATGESFGFGFSLADGDQDEVTIEHITPGSSAWKTGELNKGDVITAIRWGIEAPVELMGEDAEEIESLIAGKRDNKIELTVRKADGKIKTVKLQKAKVVDEDDFVKSYVLNGDIKTGYIMLPGFYSEWESHSGKNCADDVAREVVKLKRENVQAIILDLRYNGGGAMTEAMALAGIFIDEGILAFAKDNSNKASGFRDPNRGTIYDGPLLVMVNRASASASEMVAGALQDYHRALIVGAPTYGKASMQIVLPLDTNFRLETATEANLKKGTEFVKVSNGKFYRVTGKTHQLTGVQPDIRLPDVTEAAEYAESYSRYALAPDTVRKAVYFSPLMPLPVSELARRSHDRVAASAAFMMVDSASAFMVEKRNESHQPISTCYEDYLALMRRYKAESKAMEDKIEKSLAPGSYKTQHLSADAAAMTVEKEQLAEIQKSMDNIDKDIYIKECFSIIADLLKTTKK